MGIALPFEDKTRRLAIAACSAAGMLDAVYMLAFDEGLLESLWCPFLGNQCAQVGRSKHARHFGIPNAAVGAVGYAAMASLALWGGTERVSQRPLRSAALGTLAFASSAAGVYLLWEQKTKVHAYCFWCLLSTGLSLVIAGLCVPEIASGDARRVFEPRQVAMNFKKALRHPHGPQYLKESLPAGSR